ncbi:MAG: helix-turn-helix domain-containing protein [Candidatus Puniceispirillaceae bacterium]
MTLKTHDEIKKKAFEDPKVKAAYDALEQEFEVYHILMQMRALSGLTQADISAKTGMAKANISRLERSSNPGYQTLTRYAEACGYRLRLVAEPLNR